MFHFWEIFGRIFSFTSLATPYLETLYEQKESTSCHAKKSHVCNFIFYLIKSKLRNMSLVFI